MCTLSWSVDPGATTIFFNRDELKTRSPAEPPRLFLNGPHAHIAPVDPDSGGTWFWLNDAGVCALLLNFYPATHTMPANPVSRGSVMNTLVAERTPEATIDRLENMNLAEVRPFTLAVFAPGKVPGLIQWNRETLARLPAGETGAVTSSSFQTEAVEGSRLARYDELAATGKASDPAALRAFHLQHDPANGEASVTMIRSDGETHSMAAIALRPTEATLDYAEKIPDVPTYRNPLRYRLPVPASGQDVYS